jgi:AraC-like DNA-binding protein
MRGASISGYADVARRLGLDPRAMLRRFHIDPRALDEPELRIPGDRVIALLETSAGETGTEAFGLMIAETRQISDYGPISLLLAHQPSLRDALETMIRYQRMLNQALFLHLEDAGGVVCVKQEVAGVGEGVMRQAHELAVGTIYRTFRWPRASRWRALSVHFTHAPPRDMTVHRRVFDAPIEFNSGFNGFAVSQADMDALNPLADAALARHAEQFIRSLPHAEDVHIATEVERAIQVLLPFNGASITAVSARLGVNRRTLQRRLADEGADFTAILNRIRRQHAMRYLSGSRASIAEIAGLVGYSQETSFARWFAGEFGVSPSAWRSPRH